MASSGRTTAVKGGSGTMSTPANNIGGDSTPGNNLGSAEQNGNRRNSNGTLFSGLMTQKRSSQDAAANARRDSFKEMQPQAGFLGKMWNNFTTGTGKQ